jgi:hypothetical protein
MSISNFLKQRKFKTLPTLNIVVGKAKTLDDAKEYERLLKDIPQRTDFINFDKDGFELNENEPIFKGWSVCEEASGEVVKVATKGECKIYFDTADGVIVVNETNMSDNVTYNDLAIFFESKLELL